MNLKFLRNIAWKNITTLIVAILVFFGVSEHQARQYAPHVENVLESVRDELEPEVLHEGTVIRVYDGDTFTLDTDEKVRLIGINAPEIGDPFATSSRDLLSGLVLNKTITFQIDKEERDKYDRILAYVYVGDVFVNEVMVREGLAISKEYYPNNTKQKELNDAERSAKERGVGLWQE